MTKLSAPRRQPDDVSLGQPLVLGVDGGGTKTVAWLARLLPSGETQVLGRGLAGSANLRAVGLVSASENLDVAVDGAWNAAGQQCSPVESAVLALAGAGLPEVQAQVAAWAEKRNLAKHLQVVHDAEVVLKAGTPAGWGVALVAGTGSVAFGRAQNSATAVSGGWGYWFGDEGSAFRLGQAALQLAARAADHRGPATQLLGEILAHLEIENPREMLAVLSRDGDTRRAIAKLAGLVTKAAEQQDGVAREIVEQAGRDLAALVKGVAEELSLGPGFPLALAGGVLCGSQTVRDYLMETLSTAGLQPTGVELVPDPVSGCLKIAAENLAKGDVGGK